MERLVNRQVLLQLGLQWQMIDIRDRGRRPAPSLDDKPGVTGRHIANPIAPDIGSLAEGCRQFGIDTRRQDVLLELLDRDSDISRRNASSGEG